MIDHYDLHCQMQEETSRPLLNEIAKLRQQLAEKDAEIERMKSSWQAVAIEDMTNQLAASQAREAVLREAFHAYIDEHEECTDADGWMAMICPMDAHHVADEALSQPADTSALKAIVQRAGEVMRERCMKYCDEAESQYFDGYEFRNVLPSDMCDEIRAMPGVTLEDLK